MEVSTGDTASVIRKGHRESGMSKVFASITTSIDGYVFGPGKGLGEGGERLHYWVFGGPWSYDEEPPVIAGTGRAGVVRLSCRSHGFCGRRSEHVRGRQPPGRHEPLGRHVLSSSPTTEKTSAGLWSPRATVPVG